MHILARVQRILCDQTGDPVEKFPATEKFDEMALDSIDGIEIVMALEEEFDIEIPDTDAEKFVTVQDAVDCITRLVAEQN